MFEWSKGLHRTVAIVIFVTLEGLSTILASNCNCSICNERILIFKFSLKTKESQTSLKFCVVAVVWEIEDAKEIWMSLYIFTYGAECSIWWYVYVTWNGHGNMYQLDFQTTSKLNSKKHYFHIQPYGYEKVVGSGFNRFIQVGKWGQWKGKMNLKIRKRHAWSEPYCC